ncbi:hypothetical protein GE061_003456 [Apolygus lucorum]|uniref:Uncharacterized protein n=1 Tax=Apolygus lucorum TaxID=248454 RepID=A0A6A4JSB1_APOLU|nr:hypothetical protein GE061_003456 [Apolygus lucorum]
MGEKEVERRFKKALLKDIEKTVLDLTALGMPKRKLDKLVSYLYNVDAKGVARTVLTLQKKGCGLTNKHSSKLSRSTLCGSIGGNRRANDPLEKCYAEENSESKNSRNNGCPERNANSASCGGRRRSSSGCGGGRCKWRRGREPCSSGKCKRKRSSSRGSKCAKKRKSRCARKRKSRCAKKRKSRCAKKRKNSRQMNELLKEMKKTVLDLTALGMPKRKLDKLVGYIFNVDAKGISRTVLNSLKKGRAQINERGTKFLGSRLCKSLGRYPKKNENLKRCNDKLSYLSNFSAQSRQPRNIARPEINSIKCGRRSNSCGGGGCKMRHGRKPCNSGKCRSKRGGKRKSRCAKRRKSKCAKKRKSKSKKRRSRKGGCGGVFQSSTAPIINSKDKERPVHQGGTSRKPATSEHLNIWYS